MPQEVEFLFGNKLIDAVTDIVIKAKKSLLLVSPFIDLDPRITDALLEKKRLSDFKLSVLFGKNDNDYMKSIKQPSIDFLKKFPNVEIRYEARLHAKYYQNETSYLMTSMNLYKFSAAHNIEVGVRSDYKGTGLLQKAVGSMAELVSDGIETISSGIFGQESDTNPVVEFAKIFSNSQVLYKTIPVVEQKGLLGIFKRNEIQSFTVEKDVIKNVNSRDNNSNILTNFSQTLSGPTPATEDNFEKKYFSASVLSKKYGLLHAEVTRRMEAAGLLQNNVITALGASKGLLQKQFNGKMYVAYPECLEELKKWKEPV